MFRKKSFYVVASLLVSGVLLLAWSQEWLHLGGDFLQMSESISVNGQSSGAGLIGLILCSFASSFVLALSGPVLSRFVGVALIFIGLFSALLAINVLIDPIAASSTTLVKMSGIANIEELRALVTGVSVTFWPSVYVVVSIALSLLGIFVLIASRHFSRQRTRYDSSSAIRSDARRHVVNSNVMPSSLEEWDELNRGVDPTR